MDSHKDDLLQAVKPLIREWMDEHFPALLEGAVRAEVERVVKARGPNANPLRNRRFRRPFCLGEDA